MSSRDFRQGFSQEFLARKFAGLIFLQLFFSVVALAGDQVDTNEGLLAIIRDPNRPMQERVDACDMFSGGQEGACTPDQINNMSSSPGGITADDMVKRESGDNSTCEGTHQNTQLTCNTMSTKGMSAMEGAQVEMMVNQLILQGNNLANIGKNAGEQCKSQANISQLMASINGIKGGACEVLIHKCTDLCEDEENQAKSRADAAQGKDAATEKTERQKQRDARKRKEACRNNQANFVAMMYQSMQFLGNMAQNKQCANQMAAYKVPEYKAPSADCSDLNNQTLVCYCQRDANKGSAMCSGFKSGLVSGGTTVPTGGGSAGAGSATPYSAKTLSPEEMAALNGELGQGKPGQGGAGGGRDPSDGGSGAPGGGGLASLGSEGGGGGSPADPKSAITGTAGGQGSGLSSGGSSGSGGLSKFGSGDNGLLSRFNLGRFLPGQKYKARGIAGMSVKSVDGITGPTGPTIWEKATKQYQEQIQKQNVILDRD